MLSKHDIAQISDMGITSEQIEIQLENFKKGFPFVELAAPATVSNNGIQKLTEEQIQEFISVFEQNLKNKTLLKFVPASGAATRMFKDLFEYLSSTSSELAKPVETFISSLEKFAFYNSLKNCMAKNGLDLKECLQNKQYKEIITALLTDSGMAYGKLPKALLEFHKYADFTRTSLEEHLSEGAFYAQDENKQVSIHFTISAEHKELFIDKIEAVKSAFQEKYNIVLNIYFSEQDPKTDTVAVNQQNEIYRDKEGKILFRPGGHGALIENLNNCSADLIFIKNIDNVVPENRAEKTHLYKKACAGYLFHLQNKIFKALEFLDNNPVTEADIKKIEDFCAKEVNISFFGDYKNFSLQEKAAYLHKKLNRPIRICGMVKNQGEPGGGPFWVTENDNQLSLQIIESAQVNADNLLQSTIFKSSTHFNPVDLICGTKNYKGEKFNLLDYVNRQTGFISEKSTNGEIIKAQELPGLWNGAMYEWITIFVEVPLETFNPVKTINDLLRIEHQPLI